MVLSWSVFMINSFCNSWLFSYELSVQQENFSNIPWALWNYSYDKLTLKIKPGFVCRFALLSQARSRMFLLYSSLLKFHPSITIRLRIWYTTSYISSILACYDLNMINKIIIVTWQFSLIPGVTKWHEVQRCDTKNYYYIRISMLFVFK